MSKKKALSFNQFIERFPSEESCAKYLYTLKWPHGYVCPKCGSRHGYAITGYGLYQCAACRHQASVIAGTMIHHSHLSLRKWFWAVYLVACDKRGISALALAGKIKICYETAWNMLRRIRKAMELRDADYMLSGIVEFDDSFFGAKTKRKEGRGAGNQGVFVAVSKDKEGCPEYLKMQTTENIKKSAVREFITKNIALSFYPKTILADRAYPSRENQQWCASLGIRLSGPRLGRKSTKEKLSESKQIYQDGCDRVVIEGTFGVAKRQYGLDRVMTRLPDTSMTSIAMGFFAANMEHKLRLLFASEYGWSLDYDFDLGELVIFPRIPESSVIQ